MSEWKKVKIGEIATESKIPETNQDASKKIRVRLNVNGVEQRPLLAEKEGATKCYERKAGQFIYGRQNFHKGAFGIIPSSLDGFSSSGDLPAFDIDDSCIPEWLLYWFKTENRYKQLLKHAKGVASQRVSTSDFYSTEIPLPDTTTQQFIINGLQSTEQKTKELESLFSDQKTYLTKLRQAILQEAIEGKLTADWRVNNPVCLGDPNTDAAALLATIKAEKQALIADGKIRKDKPLAPINPDDVPFALPEGWVWVKMNDVCDFITKGTTPPLHEIKTEGEIPFLKVYNIVNQKIDFSRSQFISELVNDKFSRSKVFSGDVLMNIVGPPLGKVALVPEDYQEWNINQAIARFRPLQKSMNKFLYLYLVSGISIKDIPTLGVVGQDNISLEQCRNMAFTLPPLAEQQAIVERVDSLLNHINALEQQVTERKHHAEQLMQAVLKEAFAG